eukprot:4458928-Karenia_brevis.AAC.1
MFQVNKLLKAFRTKFSKSSKFAGKVVDERGIIRYAELWMEKVETTEKEEKERIMRCLTKSIFDCVESSKGKVLAAETIAIKSWKDPWIVSSKQ